MTQLPDGKQSEQIETNLKRLRGVRLEGSQESKGNQNRLVTLCRKQREMQQTEAWTLSDGGR
jgi:hypothetical protein